MAERRRGPREGAKERRNPLRAKARLRPAGPAIERRQQPREGRVRMTVKLPEETVVRLRSAVFSTPGLTVAGFIEACITNGVDQMEKKRGRKFRVFKGILRAGRPRNAK